VHAQVHLPKCHTLICANLTTSGWPPTQKAHYSKTRDQEDMCVVLYTCRSFGKSLRSTLCFFWNRSKWQPLYRAHSHVKLPSTKTRSNPSGIWTLLCSLVLFLPNVQTDLLSVKRNGISWTDWVNLMRQLQNKSHSKKQVQKKTREVLTTWHGAINKSHASDD
jgi:hypothetical protein